MNYPEREERKKAFIVFASSYEEAMKYLTQEQRGEYFELLGRFAFYDEEVHSKIPMVDMLLGMTIPNMIAAEKRHQIAVENGTKGKAFGKQGGRPRKNETEGIINPKITPNKPLNIDIDKYKDIEVDINKDKNRDKDKNIDIDKEINKNKDNNKNIDKDIERDKDRDKEEDNTNKTINQLLSIISQLLVSSNIGSISTPSSIPSIKEQTTGDGREKDYNPNYALARKIRDDLRLKAKQDNTKPLDEVNCRIVDEVETDNPKFIDSKPTPPQIKHDKEPGSDDSKLLQEILTNIINSRTMGYEVEEDYLDNAYLLYAQIHNIINLDDAKKKVEQIIDDNLNGYYSDDDET